MTHLSRFGIIFAALMFCVLHHGESAQAHIPEITLLKQQFTANPVSPLRLADAVRGSLVIHFKSSWDEGLFGFFELRLNPEALPVRIFEGEVKVPADYPVEFSRPHIAVQGDQVTITISDVNALKYKSFSIGVRAIGHAAPWVSFEQELVPSVNCDHVIDLANRFDYPQGGQAALEQWISELFEKTLVVLGTERMLSIAVDYFYSVSPGIEASLPIIFTVPMNYDPSLAATLSRQILDWYEKAAPQSTRAALNFNLTIFKGKPEQVVPQIQLSKLRLPVERIDFNQR